MVKKARAVRYATAAQVRAVHNQLKDVTTLLTATVQRLDRVQDEVRANVRRIGEVQHEIDTLRNRLNRP